jgi:Domain of unknown function (DUF4412)
MNHRNVVASLAALAFAWPASAGLIITAEQGGGEPTSKSTTYLQGKKLRMEHSQERDGAGRVTVFDGDAHRLLEIDPAARTYRVMTEEQGKEVSAQLQKMLSQLPPEQRARAEAALAARRASSPKRHEFRFEPLGTAEVVAGYPCQRYRVMRDGRREEEGCFIPWSTRAVARDDLAAFVEMGHFIEGFAANAAGRPAPAGTGHWMTDEIAGAPGFPAVLERIERDGKRTTVHRLVKLERRSVPAELFAAPAGFAEVTKPMLGDGETRRARRGR